jgi:hypothetical protein
MFYLQRKYSVYHLGNGLYLLSDSMRKASFFEKSRRQREQQAKTPRRRFRLIHTVYQTIPRLLRAPKTIH